MGLFGKKYKKLSFKEFRELVFKRGEGVARDELIAQAEVEESRIGKIPLKLYYNKGEAALKLLIGACLQDRYGGSFIVTSAAVEVLEKVGSGIKDRLLSGDAACPISSVYDEIDTDDRIIVNGSLDETISATELKQYYEGIDYVFADNYLGDSILSYRVDDDKMIKYSYRTHYLPMIKYDEMRARNECEIYRKDYKYYTQYMEERENGYADLCVRCMKEDVKNRFFVNVYIEGYSMPVGSNATVRDVINGTVLKVTLENVKLGEV